MNNIKKKYDLTIGIIVKNEEKYLEKCLKSLLPLKEHLECEIIVTDTGSTDTTVEIAEKYADKVLHFNWCNDFAKARNTGVDISQGAWFMFVDADEIFEDSVIEIAKFIKSKDRDKYDCATYNKKDFQDNRLTKFNIVTSVRLFNFTKGVRFFKGEVHECIPYSENIFNLESYLLHYGCVASILGDKAKRNKLILEKQYKNTPRNIGVIRRLFSVSGANQKVLLANKAFEIIDIGATNNYKNIEDRDFVFSLYCDLSRIYLNRNEHDLVIKTCERYFNTKLVQQYLIKPNLPTQEILFMFGLALYKKRDYNNALDNLIKYKEMYDQLQVYPNKFNQSAYVYRYNNELDYEKCINFIIDIYIKLGDNEKCCVYLSKSALYKYGIEDISLLDSYITKIIICNREDLFKKAMIYCNENNLSDKWNKRISVLVAKILFYLDISYFINNYDESSLNACLTWGYKHIPQIRSILYKILSKDVEVNNLKEVKIYIQMAYFYLIEEVVTLSNNNVDIGLRKKIDEVFTNYLELMIYYIFEVYQPVMSDESSLDMLTNEESLCVVISRGFENRLENPFEYIQLLKDSLSYDVKFKEIVLNCIYVIENQEDTKCIEKSQVQYSEFELLAQKIKGTIKDFILKHEFEQAKTVLEQYKLINPNDTDINILNKMI